jgi:hypothetical protein
MDPLDSLKTLAENQSPTVALLILAITLISAVFGGVVKIIQLSMESRASTRTELLEMNKVLRAELHSMGERISALEKDNESKNHTIHALEFKMAVVRRVVFERFNFDIDDVAVTTPQ